jgi:hypothetical protein
MSDYSYIGSGKVYLRTVGSGAPLRFVGNVSALSFSISEDVKELKDYTKPGGGTYNEVRRVQSVEASMTLHDLSPENLAVALFGNSSAISAGAVTDEEHALYRGGLVKLDAPIDTAVVPVVTLAATPGARANSTAVALNDLLVPAAPNGFYYRVSTAGTTDAAPPTFPTTVGATVTDGTAVLTCMGRVNLTASTDFIAVGGGIEITADAAITDGQVYDVDYTRLAGDAVEALLNASQEYEIVFDGLNEARSGKSVSVHVFRQKLGAASNVPFIGDEYAALELTGKLLKDTSRNGTSESQYFKIQLVS